MKNAAPHALSQKAQGKTKVGGVRQRPGGITIGLALTFVHIIGIPLTVISVNPARSFGPALAMFTQSDATALSQVFFFPFFLFVKSETPGRSIKGAQARCLHARAL